MSPAETDVAIEMPFASTTLVGPGKQLLHIADRFGRILYCVHSTQYSLLVYFDFSAQKTDNVVDVLHLYALAACSYMHSVVAVWPDVGLLHISQRIYHRPGFVYTTFKITNLPLTYLPMTNFPVAPFPLPNVPLPIVRCPFFLSPNLPLPLFSCRFYRCRFFHKSRPVFVAARGKLA